jgi:hypothetical protein
VKGIQLSEVGLPVTVVSWIMTLYHNYKDQHVIVTPRQPSDFTEQKISISWFRGLYWQLWISIAVKSNLIVSIFVIFFVVFIFRSTALRTQSLFLLLVGRIFWNRFLERKFALTTQDLSWYPIRFRGVKLKQRDVFTFRITGDGDYENNNSKNIVGLKSKTSRRLPVNKVETKEQMKIIRDLHRSLN